MRLQPLQWSWNYLCAAWLLCVLLAAYTVAVVSGFTTSPFMALMVSLWSMKILYLLPLLLLIPHLQKWWGIVLILLPMLGCFIWQVASLELYAVQCRFLSFEELTTLWSQADTRPLITEQLFSFAVLFFIIAFYAVFFLSAHLLERYLAQRYAAGVVPMVVLALLIGSFYVSERKEMYYQFKPAQMSCMPWSWLSSSNGQRPIARLSVAEEKWDEANELFWQAGPSAVTRLASPAYKNRSIIVILMESHGSHYLDEIGKGSVDHKASSPFLSQLARDHIYFENFFQSGYVTHHSTWSLLSGFPYFDESGYTPHLARLGLIPAFQKAGYTCEWLQATTTVFANFNELLHNLNIYNGVTATNSKLKRDEDDSLWSAWGMPDEQLFELAYNHMAAGIEKGARPHLQFLLTISNHNPYHLPKEIDGEPLLRDPSGGMRYADACLQTFMKKIATIDPAQRPIVFITADTGFRSVDQIVFDDGNLWAEPLESLRVPGVLVLPDASLPSQTITDVCCHEDVLAMLAQLTGVEHTFTQRMQNYHRSATVINDYDWHTIVSNDYYFYEGVSLLAIRDYWKLDWISPQRMSGNQQLQNVNNLMRQRYLFLNDLRHAIWLHAGNSVVARDKRWDVIDSYEKPSPKQQRTQSAK